MQKKKIVFWLIFGVSIIIFIALSIITINTIKTKYMASKFVRRFNRL